MNKNLLTTSFAICLLAFGAQAERVCTATSEIKFDITENETQGGQFQWTANDYLTANFTADNIDGWVPYVTYTDASNNPIEGSAANATFHKMAADGNDYSYTLTTFVDNSKENSWKAFIKLVPEDQATAETFTSTFSASDPELYSVIENTTQAKNFPYNIQLYSKLSSNTSYYSREKYYLTSYGNSTLKINNIYWGGSCLSSDCVDFEKTSFNYHKIFDFKGINISCKSTNYAKTVEFNRTDEGEIITYDMEVTIEDEPLTSPMRKYTMMADLSYFMYRPNGFSTTIDETKIREIQLTSEYLSNDFVITYPELTSAEADCNYVLIDNAKESGATKTIAYTADVAASAPRYGFGGEGILSAPSHKSASLRDFEGLEGEILPPPTPPGFFSSTELIIYKEVDGERTEILRTPVDLDVDNYNTYSTSGKYFISAVEQLENVYAQMAYTGEMDWSFDIPMASFIYSKPLPLNITKDSITINGDITNLTPDNYNSDYQAGEVTYKETNFVLKNFEWFFNCQNFEDENINNAIEYTKVSIVNKDKNISLETEDFMSQSHYEVSESGCNKNGYEFEDNVSSAITWSRTYEVTVNPHFSVYTPWYPTPYDSGLDEIQYGVQVENLSFTQASGDVKFVTDYLTGVEGVSGTNATISAHNGNIYVNGAENIVIYNANGSEVYSGSDNVIPMNSGLYIVKAGNATQKVIVK